MPALASICDILEAHLAVFVPCMTDQVIKIGPDLPPRSSEALRLQLCRHAPEKHFACRVRGETTGQEASGQLVKLVSIGIQTEGTHGQTSVEHNVSSQVTVRPGLMCIMLAKCFLEGSIVVRHPVCICMHGQEGRQPLLALQ